MSILIAFLSFENSAEGLTILLRRRRHQPLKRSKMLKKKLLTENRLLRKVLRAEKFLLKRLGKVRLRSLLNYTKSTIVRKGRWP